MDSPLIDTCERKKNIISGCVTGYFLIINTVLLGYVVSMYSILHNFGDIGEQAGNKAKCMVEYFCSSSLFLSRSISFFSVVSSGISFTNLEGNASFQSP